MEAPCTPPCRRRGAKRAWPRGAWVSWAQPRLTGLERGFDERLELADLPVHLGALVPALAGVDPDLPARLQAALKPDLPLDKRAGDFIAPGYDAALDDLRDAGSGGRRTIAALEGELKSRTGISALKIRHNGVLGYHVEVPARAADPLMRPDSGFTHRQTLAGVVRFNAAELHEQAMRVGQA